MAKITKKSVISGKVRTLNIPQYEENDFEARYLAYRQGRMTLEDAFDRCSPTAQLFIRNGTTPEEYSEYDAQKTS